MTSSRVRYSSAPQRAHMSGAIESVSARQVLEKIGLALAKLSGAPLTQRLTEHMRDGEGWPNPEATGGVGALACNAHRAGRFPADGVPLVLEEAGGRQPSTACRNCRACACVTVCPTGALAAGTGGRVRLERARCLGCGYCAIACAHGVPQFPEGTSAGGRGAMKQRVLCPDGPPTEGDRVGQSASCREAEITSAPHSATLSGCGPWPLISISLDTR